MKSARLNISLPQKTVSALNREVKPRERSKFIAEAINNLLKKRQEQCLAREYQEAANGSRKVNQDLEGALGDGLD